MSERKEKENNGRAGKNGLMTSADENPSRRLSFFAFSEKLASSNGFQWIMIAFLPILILLAYPVDRSDYDLWWHLAHGQYYVTHHTLKMDLSIFSWTPTDPTWIYNTCLGSIAVYLFYHAGGGFGLWLFQWLIFGGVFLSFYLFLRVLNQRLDVTSVTIIAAIGIACCISCCFYKPELFSVLLFSWSVFILFYIKITHRQYLFYLYPLIFAFWVNLHGLFLVGLIFLAMAFAGEILNRIFFSRESLTTEALIHFGIAIVLSGVATLLNPYGIDYLKTLFPAVMMAMGSQSHVGPYDKAIWASISLWPYLKNMKIAFFFISLTSWLMTFMMASILFLSVYEFVKKKSLDFTLLIISVALYWKGMEIGRMSCFFSIAFFFVFFYGLIHRLKIKNMTGKATLLSLFVLIFFLSSVLYINTKYQADSKWFGQGLDDFAPVEEVVFLKQHKLNGLIFNDYLIGGYLIWKLYPDYKVFIDSRNGPYLKEVSPDYFDFTLRSVVTREDIRRFREKYPFNIAIFHYREMPLIFSFLGDGNEWRLLYFGKNAAVLVHQSLFPFVPWEKVNANLSPSRFKTVKNPEILMNVFNFYVRLNPNAGRYIYDLFKNNISDYFSQKHKMLIVMDKQIRLKEKGLLR